MSTMAVEPLYSNKVTNPDLVVLHEYANEHDFWKNTLLSRFVNNELSLEQLQLFFSQYYFYSKNFIRLLATMIVKCKNELLNRNLIHNLWEEAGENDLKKSHPLLFRRFLTDGLKVENIQELSPMRCTEDFVSAYIKLCMESSPLACAAILGFATEGMVPRLYSLFKESLLNKGISEAELEFFTVHIGCDDGHAEALEEIVKYYSGDKGWVDDCKKAIDRAFNLRGLFFNCFAGAGLVPHN